MEEAEITGLTREDAEEALFGRKPVLLTIKARESVVTQHATFASMRAIKPGVDEWVFEGTLESGDRFRLLYGFDRGSGTIVPR